MKKQILLLAAGLLCAACTKEMAPDDNVSGDRFVLRASLEQDKSDGKTDSGEEGEKTTLNEDTGAVLWAEGDKIKAVWNGGSAESVGLSTGAVAYAEFSFESMGGTPAYVVYPSSVTSTWDGTDFKVTFPSTQGGTFSEASLEAGPVDVVGRRIFFKNLGALVKLTISDDDVRTIWLQGAGNTPLAGTAIIRFGENGLPVVDSVEEGSSSIKLGISAPGTYYVGVLPIAIKEGIYVELQNGDGDVIGQKITTNTMSLARREILDLGTIGTGNFSDVCFVSPSGEGNKDGSDWDNAMPLSTFKDQCADGTLNGKKIFIQQGNYSISQWGFTAAVNFEAYGGYPSTLTGTDLKGRDIVNCPTTIDGASSCIFTFNHADLSVKWDGLVITGAGGKARAGNVITVTAATKVLFTNCTIKDNENSSSSYSGLLAVSGGQNVSFRKCVFSGNTSNAGGSIAKVVAGNNLVFKDCLFHSNSTSGSQGFGGLFNVEDGTATFSGCSFTNNHSKKDGGVFYVTGGAVSLTDCTGSGNYAPSSYQGGFVYNTNGSVTLGNGCVLSGNSAPNGGVAYQDGTGSITLSGSTLSDNSATLYGGALYLGSGTLTAEDCTLSGNHAPKFGGCLYMTDGTARFSHCEMTGNRNTNTAGAGGFSYATGGSLTLENSSFIGNTSSLYGGVAYLLGGSLAVNDCIFSENQSYHGSCLAANATSETTIALNLSGNTFSNNYDIPPEGGGLTGVLCLNFLSDCIGTVTLDATDCIFSNNLAYTTKITDIKDLGHQPVGPACINLGPSDRISNTTQVTIGRLNGCVFDNNMASISGGAVRCVQHGSTLYMNRCWFYNNKTYSTASALRSIKGGRVAMNNCVFYNNYTIDYSNTGESYPSVLFCNHSPTLIVNTSVMQDNNVPSERCLFLGGSAKTTADAQDSTIFANNIFYHYFSYNSSMNCYSIRTRVHQHNTDPYSTYPYGDAYIKSYGHNLYSKNAIADTAGRYTLIDAVSHRDFVATARLNGEGGLPSLKWKKQTSVGRPIIYLSALPVAYPTTTKSYVESAISAWDTVNETATKVGQTFADWLASLPVVEGNVATAIDCRGKLRNASYFWPGSHQIIGSDPDPDNGEE